jgi:hypothetical protein
MKKQVLLLALMLNFGVSFAQNNFWLNTNKNNKFDDDANWSLGWFPDKFNPAVFRGFSTNADCIVTGVHEVGAVRVGGGGTVPSAYGSLIIKKDAHLICVANDWSAVGLTTYGKLVVEAGGTYTFNQFWLGLEPVSEGDVILSGTINVGTKANPAMFGMNFYKKEVPNESTITINNGGILNCSQWSDAGESIYGPKMKIKIMPGGTINIIGDKQAVIANHVAANQIVAPGGAVQVVFTPGVPNQDPADPGMTVITSTAPLSVKDFAILDFTAYPNPATNFININAKSTISNLKIYNNLGQIVKEETNKTAADISGLSSGIYMIKVTDELGNSGVNKFIKQ